MSAPLNFQALFELDTTPETTATYVRIGDGLSTATPNNNEKKDEKAYLDDNGGMTTAVTGFNHVVSFSGDRIAGNTAQDWILAKLFSVGASRVTNFRYTGPDGTVISGPCTIVITSVPGGDANSPQAFGFDVCMNGKPTKVDPVAATAFSTTIAASASTIGCTKATGAPASNMHLGYKLTAAANTAKGREYVDNYVAYTSAADIAATAGQFLSIYEIDAYEHVTKFLCEVLEAGDIKSA
jgi:hypothetical protein